MASKRKQTLQVVHPNCAGVDIGKKSHYVAVHESADTHSVRAFGCFTDELEDMAAWLESCAVDVVAMEATGVYWIPGLRGAGSGGVRSPSGRCAGDEAGQRTQE